MTTVSASAPTVEQQLWLALEICDSSFPGGAFAHSLGLESAKNHGWVNESRESLKSFVLQTLEQAVAQLLPLINQAHGHCTAQSSDSTVHLGGLYEVDEVCHTLLTNEVTRRSSRAQGKCFLRAASEAFSSTSKRLRLMTEALSKHSVPATSLVPGQGWTFQWHYAPLFGAVCGALGLTLDLTGRMFLRCLLRDIFSSAARLNIVGPLEAARLRSELTPTAEMLLSQGRNDGDERMHKRRRHEQDGSDSIGGGQLPTDQQGHEVTDELLPTVTSPILEILQARHDVLYARLFNS
jgi:urease accessory protein